MAAGESLTELMAEFARRLGIRTRLLQMTDPDVHSLLVTDVGDLEFQDYFVARRAAPTVRRIVFDGCDAASIPVQILDALASPALRAIVVCPSNPHLSIGPTLAVPSLRDQLRRCRVPIVAVCPLIGGVAVKGPTAKNMTELGVSPAPAAIMAHYVGLLDGLVVDTTDAAWAERCVLPVHVAPTLMISVEDRRRLAEETLEFARSLHRPRSDSHLNATSAAASN